MWTLTVRLLARLPGFPTFLLPSLQAWVVARLQIACGPVSQDVQIHVPCASSYSWPLLLRARKYQWTLERTGITEQSRSLGQVLSVAHMRSSGSAFREHGCWNDILECWFRVERFFLLTLTFPRGHVSGWRPWSPSHRTLWGWGTGGACWYPSCWFSDDGGFSRAGKGSFYNHFSENFPKIPAAQNLPTASKILRKLRSQSHLASRPEMPAGVVAAKEFHRSGKNTLERVNNLAGEVC